MFAPDRNHLHHRLLDLGLHHRAVVIVIYAITAICASIGIFMLTTDGKWSVTLLVGGLLLLFSMFACMHCGCGRKMLKGLKRNWAIARQVRAEKHSFEGAIVRISESTSLREWWETVCAMGSQMNFQSIGLWKCQNGDYVSTCLWNRLQDQFATGKTVKINFQVGGNRGDEYQVRACIEADDDLEACGRKTTLLARLMDEFPPPEPEAQITDQSASTKSRSTVKEEAEHPSSLAMTNTQALERPARLPTPLNVMGIPVVPFESYDQALECAGQIIELGGKSLWIAINPIKIYHAWRNPDLLKIMRQADVGICDGIGVSIASKILNGQSVTRCTGCDLFFRLVSEAERKGWGIYLLGASAQSNATARTELQRRCPDLKIVGWHDGYFEDSEPVIKQINSSRADLLFVAMGSPKQEQWMWRHKQAININICMGIGGSLDVASGSIKRAPRVFRMIGAEFLFRFLREPRKRWRIQKVLFPYFASVLGKKVIDLTLSDEGREE
jgi:N-acetylglucosaminyldiphosphoundecaprenol N-acetyl-beta-D-mannosaminyltransferase